MNKEDAEGGKTVGKIERAGGIVLNVQKTHLLLVFGRYHNLWSLPKGHLKPDETPKECAKREIYEETGLMVELTDQYIKRNHTMFYYANKLCNHVEKHRILNPIDKQEIQKARWIKLQDIQTIPANMCLKYIVGVLSGQRPIPLDLLNNTQSKPPDVTKSLLNFNAEPWFPISFCNIF